MRGETPSFFNVMIIRLPGIINGVFHLDHIRTSGCHPVLKIVQTFPFVATLGFGLLFISEVGRGLGQAMNPTSTLGQRVDGVFKAAVCVGFLWGANWVAEENWGGYCLDSKNPSRTYKC